MNLNLNTQQIVLLCLLVAFVTSITTAISVVSLTNQNPEPVTQTINRVVEKTIETVTEPKEENTVVTKTPNKEVVTVVVNQEDLTVDSVERNSKSLARIHFLNKGVAGEFVTIGIVVSTNSIVVDRNLITKKGLYIAKTKLGDLPVEILFFDEKSNFALLKLKDGKTGLEKAEFADSNTLQLAQSVISLSGSTDNSVSTGIINKLDSFDKSENENTWKEITNIYTSVDPNNVLVGSVLLNLQGKIVGVKTFDSLIAKTTFTPSNVLKSFLGARGI